MRLDLYKLYYHDLRDHGQHSMNATATRGPLWLESRSISVLRQLGRRGSTATSETASRGAYLFDFGHMPSLKMLARETMLVATVQINMAKGPMP